MRTSILEPWEQRDAPWGRLSPDSDKTSSLQARRMVLLGLFASGGGGVVVTRTQRERMIDSKSAVKRDPERLQLSQGATLKPDESERCS